MPEKAKNIKKIAFIAGGAIVGLAFLIGIFWSGIEIGKKYYPSINLIKGLENKEAGKPANVDFSLFWDAWRTVQTEYLKSDKLDIQKMVYGSIKGLLSSLGDSYSVFFTPEQAKIFNEDSNGSFEGVGMEIGIRKEILTVISPLEDTPAWRAGIKPGDKILEIDGQSTENITTEEAVRLIRGERGTSVVLNIIRDGFDKPQDFSVQRDIIIVPAVKVSFLEKNIAHLKVMSFSENAPYEFYQAALEIINKNSPAIVLDLRNDPGGYLGVSVHIAGWFLEKGEVAVRENIKDSKEEEMKTEGPGVFSKVPVVVLVNRGSASASEILAGALRDIRGIKLVGEKTFGKGSVQTVKELFDSSLVKITIAEWLTPNGISINENGLEPDYKVELPDNWQEKDSDLQLQKAIEVLASQ